MSGVVVDASAVIAILTDGPGSDALAAALEAATPRVMGAPTRLELGIVFEARFGAAGGGVIERFLRDADIEVLGFDRDHADRAIDGWRRYGKGRHRAALNFGDCCSYGVAAVTGFPVLCVGDDFPATDVAVLRPPG